MTKTGDTIRVTKLFHFEMAHALFGHDGPCKNIHGHSYQLSVTIIGKPLKIEGDPKVGMIIDFSALKKMVETVIVKQFDHSLVLNEKYPYKTQREDEKIIWVKYQPTCENLLIEFAQRIKKVLPPEVTLHHLLLRETPTSYAEWYAEDNP